MNVGPRFEEGDRVFKIPVRFEVGDESINRIVRKVVMSLQAQVTEIIAKLDKVATDAVEEKTEVLAALDALNGEVAIANGKVESANTEIASLKAEIIKLQEQIAAGETVDLAPLAAKVDTLEGLVEDIYVTPVVE